MNIKDLFMKKEPKIDATLEAQRASTRRKMDAATRIIDLMKTIRVERRIAGFEYDGPERRHV